jgi:hypothetical protein
MKTAELFKQVRRHCAAVVADESRQSLPVPILSDDESFWDFLFFPGRLDPMKGTMLSPPQHRVRFTHNNGELVFVRVIKLEEFGLGHEPFQELGFYTLPEGWNVGKYLDVQSEVFELYDRLAPAFFAHRNEGELRALGQTFVPLLESLIEPPVREYYLHEGKDFFAWLKQLG